MKKILVVDDEKPISDIIKFNLKKEGYDVYTAYDGEEALQKVEEINPDLILLDLMLPKIDGLEVAREVRKTNNMPIIMVTAKDAEIDKVLGLEMGADDYVVKPFSPITLIARSKALHRRATIGGGTPNQDNTAEKFDAVTDHLKLSTTTREVFLDDKPLNNLTPKEFDLLKTLAQKPRQVFSREQLLQLVWDYEYYGDERTVDAHIKKIRQKIETVGPQVIQTVWGGGYKFDDSEVK